MATTLSAVDSATRPAQPTWACWLVSALLAMGALAPTPAAAQDYTAQQIEQFKRLLGSATDSYEAGRYRQALASLKEARQIIDHPRISFRLGRVYEKLNRCDDARDSYRAFLESDKISEKQRSQARGKLDGLEERCQSTGKLAVECTPEGARLIVGDHQVLCPAKLALDAGDYTAVIRASGYESKTFSVTVPAGGSVQQTVALARDKQAARRDKKEKKFEVQMQRAHEAFEAGRFEEALEAFDRADQLLDRPHVTYQQALTYEQLDRCADAERAYTEFLADDQVDRTLRDRAQRRLRSIDERCTTTSATRPTPPAETDGGGGVGRALPWVVAGVGAGLLAGGVASDATAIQRTEQLQQSGSSLAELRQEADSARVRTIGLYAGGTALFVGGIIWKIATLSGPDDPSADKSADRPRLRPTVGPRAAGLRLRW